MLDKILVKSLVIFGSISVLIGVLDILFPNQLNYGWLGLIGVLFACLIIGFFISLPKKIVLVAFNNPEITIKIKIGDILNEDSHLVIGFSDCFDTEIGDVISALSLQGKFTTKIYSGNIAKLNGDLDNSLAGESFVVDENKIKGKNLRYKIGTVAVLDDKKRKFFCCAYSKMGIDLKAESNIDEIWMSLKSIWEKINLKGELAGVSMPVIGLNLSRVNGSSCALMIKMIALSFIAHSRNMKISKELTIVISKEDGEKVNLLELEDFLKNINS